MSKLDLGRFFTINNCNFSVMFTTENQGLSVVLDGRYIGYTLRPKGAKNMPLGSQVSDLCF